MKQFFKFMFASVLGVLIATLILVIVGICFFAGLAATSSSSKTYSPGKNSVLQIDLKGALTETTSDNPFNFLLGNDTEGMSVEDAVKAIRRAKENPNIKGIYLNAGSIQGGFASLETIRRELTTFKKSGKFIIAYGDIYSQGDYYLCSTADSIFLNPEGTVSMVGLASQAVFYTGLAEKLGVEFNIFKVGTYKSAVEPYFLKKMSDANREQLTSTLNNIWGNFTTTIAKDRKIPIDSLTNYMNKGLAAFNAGDLGGSNNAITYKLADALRYRYEVENCVKKLAGQDMDDELKTINVEKTSTIAAKEKSSKNKIAVLYASGEIIEENGTTSNPMNMAEANITYEIAKSLRKLKKDEDVKAVVFRVNSPGGSAFVSEQIWKEVYEMKKVKPIVVSMGDYAASGGYYISCAANEIVAEKTTITGSIGVFGLFPNFAGSFGKVGLTTDVVKTNTYADLGDFSRPMREDEKVLIQHSVEHTYDIFLTHVAEGRGKTKAEVDSIGQGRIWSGEQGLKLGLVDKIGGIDVAVNEAAKLAKVKDFKVVKADGPKDFLTKYFEEKFEGAKVSIVKSVLGDEYELFNTIQRAKREKGIIARIPYNMNTM